MEPRLGRASGRGLKKANQAADSLRVLLDKSTWPNLFDLHPPGLFNRRKFWRDGGYCGDAVAEPGGAH